MFKLEEGSVAAHLGERAPRLGGFEDGEDEGEGGWGHTVGSPGGIQQGRCEDAQSVLQGAG